MGANSATDIMEMAKASPFVFSMTNNKTAKFRTHIPICKNNPEKIMAWNTRFLKMLGSLLFNVSDVLFANIKTPCEISGQEAVQYKFNKAKYP